jgi:hypothetical protein
MLLSSWFWDFSTIHRVFRTLRTGGNFIPKNESLSKEKGPGDSRREGPLP